MKSLTLDISTSRWLACRLLKPVRRSICWSSLSNLRFTQKRLPDLPGPDWVRCKTLFGGICGTDINTLLLRQPPDSILRGYVSLPMYLGHENVARIETAGAQLDPSCVGTRVCVEPELNLAHVKLPESVSYKLGNTTAENWLSLGYNNWTGGSWSEYFVAHRSQLHPVPENVPNEQAILVDPLACAARAILHRPPGNQGRVLIWGGGIIGLGVLVVLRAMGCSAEITCVVRHAHQHRLAQRFGADHIVLANHRDLYTQMAKLTGATIVRGMMGARTLAGGFDIVYDCVGSRHTLRGALDFTRRRGTVVVLGTSHARNVSWTPIWFSELNVIGSYGRLHQKNGSLCSTYKDVLEWMENKKLPVIELLTHTFSLDDYDKAFSMLMDKGGHAIVKAAFKF